MPALVTLADGAATAIAAALAHLHVDEARMRANLDAAGGVARAEGLVAALAPRIGRIEAARLVAGACGRAVEAGRDLADVAAGDAAIGVHLDPAAVRAAVDPVRLTRNAQEVVRRALRRRQLDRKGPDHG
jgi:adenylosuccinate lyase